MPVANHEHRPCRMRDAARALVLAVVLAACGCRSAPQPGVLVEHFPGEGSKTCPIPYTATYVLSAVDATSGELVTLERAKIEEKSQVGFVHQPDGEFIAYAGGRKWPLPEGHYLWQITPDSQKTRGEVRQGEVGKVLAVTGTALGKAGVFVLGIAGKMLYGLASVGGHN